MEYNDYELVYLAQENDEVARKILYEKYKDIIYKKAKRVLASLRQSGIELSDVLQESIIGFEDAINNYNQDDKAIFYTFVNVCIDRQLVSFTRKLNGKKYQILNDAITLEEDNEQSCLYNVLSNNTTPEKELDTKEKAKELYKKIKDSLTLFEDMVFELKLNGFNYNEIAQILDIESKVAYNAVDRIKTKITKLLEK